MKFADFICFDAVVAELEATDRDGVIAELVLALADASKLAKSKVKEVTRAVIKRENEASTGMGKSIAVPHVKCSAVKQVIAAVGRSSVGIDFSSLDKQPVYSIFLLISPLGEPDKHLQAMETIFKHLQSEMFRKFLRQEQSAERIIELLREADENPAL